MEETQNNIKPKVKVPTSEIKANCIKWTKENLGDDFSFREYQLENIVKIIANCLNTKMANTVCEAPTGSGKSIIVIVSAGVLADYYDKSSYILCSDLYLWDQYDIFIKKHLLKNFGAIKGIKGNYICDRNLKDAAYAECRMMGVSWNTLADPIKAADMEFLCAETCEYCLCRAKAKKSNVTLMPYQLFLKQMLMFEMLIEQIGYMQAKDKATFQPRDIIFCDECHKIPTIVQSWSQTSFDIDEFEPLLWKMYEDAKELIASNYSTVSLESALMQAGILDDFNPYIQKFREFYHEFLKPDCVREEFAKTYFNMWDNYLLPLEQICLLINKLIEMEKQTNPHATPLVNFSKIYKNTFKYKLVISSTNCILSRTFRNSEFAIDADKYFYKNVNEDRKTGKLIPQYGCAKEDVLIWRWLLKWQKHSVMLSATVGDVKAFDENIGTKYMPYKESWFLRIPSTFDFSNSPIYYVPTYRMNYSNIEKNLKYVAEYTKNIMMAFAGKHGIIHTASYKLAKRLQTMMPKELQDRMYLYGDSKSKAIMLSNYLEKPDGVLVGPTLVDGIDLPDDYVRFIIIMKIPFPVITDELVKTKIDLFPLWYNSETSNQVIQAIGRGNRHKDDWCQTFILDGSFGALFKKTESQYSDELKARMQIVY